MGASVDPRRILILKPSSLGDVVQALPVLRLLKRQLPEAQIYWWIARDLQPLLERDPDLTGCLIFDRRAGFSAAGLRSFWKSLRDARELRFDWVIDLQALARSAIFAWLVDAAFSIGLADTREGAPALYDVAVRRPAGPAHAVDWYLAVVRALGLRSDLEFEWLPPRPELAALVAQKWAPHGSRRSVALVPGARWPNKHWPARRWVELAGRLTANDPSLHVLVLGAASDEALGAVIAAARPGRVRNLCGQTILPALIEIIRGCAAMVTNDTGPMHVAAVLGIPVIGLFGPTDPSRTGPYGQENLAVRHPLECAPCLRPTCSRKTFAECLELIDVDRVVQEVQLRLQAAVAGTPRSSCT